MLAQTSYFFEWVVINDGGDPATKNLIQNLQPAFPIGYREIDHPTDGFGLCAARNAGIELASGQAIAYLDDDNGFYPAFVETIDSLIAGKPKLGAVIPQQLRRRDTLAKGQTMRRGKSFLSPKLGTSINDLVEHKALFDSNGFIHPRKNAPRWNPNYRIYCDYEYFLQCLCLQRGWAPLHFLETPLVEYVQTSDGEIGRSGYAEWADELQQLYDERKQFFYLGQNWADWMPATLANYRNKAEANVSIPAFQISSSQEVSHAE